VRLAQDKVNGSIKLPTGYEIEWGGHFENQWRANSSLAFVLPVPLVIIFALLFATFHSLKASEPHPSERPVRISGRHRGSVAPRFESELIGFRGLHRSIWRCRS
jgi:Cu/Ag efflux pump CusA